MKSLNLLPALLVLAAFTACGDAEETETVVTTPVIETPAPVYEEPAMTEVVAPAEERAAEPARSTMMGENGTPLMSEEMRYRNMDQGYTAEDFERLGVPIEDDVYGTDRY